MPAVVSHYLLAERVRNDLLEFQPQLHIIPAAFSWGASGPDIFFLHRFLPYHKGRSLKAYGSKLHHMHAEKMINYFVSFAKTHQSDIAMSYALGFVTHYAFDSTAHPFVIYFSEEMERQKHMHNSVCHNEIEANLDSLFLRYERKQKITSFSLQSTSPMKETINRTIAEMWHGFLLTYVGESVTREELVQVQRDWHTSLVLLNDKSAFKKNAVRLGERLLGIQPMLSPMIRTAYPDLTADYANMSHGAWLSAVDGQEHHETFFELAEEAEETALRLISCLLAGKPLTASQCHAPFTGKLSPENAK